MALLRAYATSLILPTERQRLRPMHSGARTSVIMAADSTRPGGRVRSPSPSTGIMVETPAPAQSSPDVSRPSNGAGGRISSPGPVDQPVSLNGSVERERPSGGSRLGTLEGGNGNPGGSSGGGTGGGGDGNQKQSGSSGGDFFKTILTWGVLYAFLASIAWLGSKGFASSSSSKLLQQK